MSLEEVRRRLASAAVILDFDGSLSPIVDDPAEAMPLPGAAEVLSSLVPRVARLAVVTGRPSNFVRERLPVPGVDVVGLYGLEGAPPPDASTRRGVARAAASEPGAHVEDKGPALVVHLRRTADPDAAAARLRPRLTTIAVATGLVLLEGKHVLELAPPGGGKGAVVRSLLTGATAALVAGDDLADVDAFDAAREMASGSDLVVCLVAVGGPETPLELLDRADVTVEGPPGLLRLLRSL